jgi:membrane protease subunit (stomatin/prohibitin family)
VTYDVTAPTVTINQGASQVDPTNTSPIVFDVVFSESVTGFTGSDVSFTGSTASGVLSASVSGSGATYTVSVSGMSGSGTVVVSLPAGAAQDAAGNTSAASSSTDHTVTYDVAAPNVTINQGSGQADPTSAFPITFEVVFTEAVIGFTGADIVFTGSTAPGTLTASVSGPGPTYTVTVSGMTGNGTVVASIPAGVALDAAGNSNSTSTSTDNSVTYIHLLRIYLPVVVKQP